MSGTEVCNLIDSLSKRHMPDSDIIEIIFETEGRQRNRVSSEGNKAEAAASEQG